MMCLQPLSMRTACLGDPDQIREHDKEKGIISHNVFLVKNKNVTLRINGETHEHEHYE